MAPVEFDRRKEAIKDLENVLAPLEIAKILTEGDKAPYTIRQLLASGEAPVRYVRDSWAKDVNYYTANLGARRLIVAFCCGGNGVGVPTAYFLQMLRDDLYDVLVLYDHRRLHFDHGVQGFTQSFMETMRRVDEFAKAKAFSEVITFGASMGGFPALRAGIMLGADRAISVGGGYCWHVARLLKQRPTPRAFDLLCPCFADQKVEMVAVTPSRYETDVKHLDTLRQTFPQVHAVLIDTVRHNVMGYMHSVRLLRLFCACLFEGWESPARPELLALLNRVARYATHVTAARTARIEELKEELHRLRRCEEELKALRASTSWRLTEPLRRTVLAMRRLKGASRG